jgi:hypothetical protein
MAIEYDPMTDHYVALGVGSTAAHDEIKKAHRALIRELHPDCGGDAMPAAQVNIAREVLLDPITREEYDRARREWHEQHLLVSAFTEAGRQIDRERARAQARAAASAAAETARRTHRRSAAHADKSTGGTAAAQAQPGNGEPPGADSTEWQPYLAKALFAGKFVHDALAGRSIAVTAIIGAATLLDHVIKHRVGDNPKLRDCLDQLSHAIWMEQVDEFKGIVETRTGHRWDPVACRWVVPKRKDARDGSSKAARTGSSSRTAAARRRRKRDHASGGRRRSQDRARRSGSR